MRFALALLLATMVGAASAETVPVKYHGPVALDSFACTSVSDGSDVTRLCHDAAERYLLVRLKTTYYHYCAVDAAAVRAFNAAPSKRAFFEANVRGNGTDGPYDCRTHPIPKKYRL